MRRFSVRTNSAPVQISETIIPAVPIPRRNFRPFAVDQQHPAEGHCKIHDGEYDVAQVSGNIRQPALQQNICVVGDDGIDARGLIAGENDAREYEWDDILAAQEGLVCFGRESCSFPPPATSCISLSSRSACPGMRERRRAAYAPSFLPRRKSQRGDSATIRLPITNKMPGGNETQKIPRQTSFLKSKSIAASPSLATCATRKL